MNSPARPWIASLRRCMAAFTFLAAVSPLSSPDSLSAQSTLMQRCQRQILTGTLERQFAASGELVSYFRYGINVNCPAERRTLRADSAHHFPQQERLELYGNVVYTEPEAVIRAQHMTYYSRSDHVEARGNVSARLASGTTLSGPSVSYFAKNVQLRESELLEATGRPTFILVDEGDTTIVNANRIFVNGDEIFGSGEVVINRSDVDARADTMYANSDPDSRLLRLMRNPELNGKGDEAFVMRGLVIDITADSSRAINRVYSTTGANVVSEQLRLVADTIDLRLTDGVMSRAYAFGDSGAVMESGDYELSADSLDIHMPGQRPSDITAVGRALARITPDTSHVQTDLKDFMKGDTLLVHFERILRARARPAVAAADPVDSLAAITLPVAPPPPDSATVPKSMVAIGDASLLFQRGAPTAPRDCPVLHYASGSSISVVLSDGGVRGMSVARDTVQSRPAMGLTSECVQRQGSGAGRSGGGATPGAARADGLRGLTGREGNR